MKKKALKDAVAFLPPNHSNMTAMVLHNKEESGLEKVITILSHFLPGGKAEWSYEDSPTEKVYFVLEGTITVNSKAETFVLHQYDSISILPFEGREVVNNTNLPATVLVTITTA